MGNRVRASLGVEETEVKVCFLLNFFPGLHGVTLSGSTTSHNGRKCPVGYFTAMEQPDLLLEDIHAFARTLR
jgi:hypothetical protein